MAAYIASGARSISPGQETKPSVTRTWANASGSRSGANTPVRCDAAISTVPAKPSANRTLSRPGKQGVDLNNIGVHRHLTSSQRGNRDRRSTNCRARVWVVRLPAPQDGRAVLAPRQCPNGGDGSGREQREEPGEERGLGCSRRRHRWIVVDAGHAEPGVTGLYIVQEVLDRQISAGIHLKVQDVAVLIAGWRQAV